MSAIKDFSKVWYEKFPGSELPPAWEEDVKNNLSKHKQRVVELQNELQQEEVYVQFLESLLEEVEKRKTSSDTKNKEVLSSENGQSERNISDVIKDTLERRSMMAPDNGLSGSTEELASPTETKEKSVIPGPPPGSWKRNGNGNLEKSSASSSSKEDIAVSRRGEVMKKSRHASGESTDEQSDGEDGSKDHFVTVIEVDGASGDKKGSSTRASGVQSDENKRLRKIPPRPPPKSFKRASEGGPAPKTPGPTGRLSFSSFGLDTTRNVDRSENKLKLVEDKPIYEIGDRPVVFDSRSKSITNQQQPPVTTTAGASNSGSSSSSSSLSSAAKEPIQFTFPKPQAFKKFEGSKLPLPPQGETFELPRPRRKALAADHDALKSGSSSSSSNEKESAPGRSKIFDLVNKMEANSQQRTSDQVTPRRSFRKSKDSILPSSKSDALMADYMDPCDAELEIVTDQIYDCPPTEPESPTSNKNSLEKPAKPSKKPTKKEHANGAGHHVDDQGIELESEPMYDTVAPDQDQEDDYVVLLEDEDGSNKPETSSNSLTKKHYNLRSGSNDQSSYSAQNTDSATIKSQTSVISSQSITTTTSSGTTSDTEGITPSPLPQDGSHDGEKNPTANYVNIEYFLCKSKRKDSRASAESEDDEPALMRAISYDQDADGGESTDGGTIDTNIDDLDLDSVVNNGTMDRSGVFKGAQSITDLRTEAATMSIADQEKIATYRIILSNIATSESAYVEVLNKLLQYMKAIKATLATSKPVLSTDEFNIIFYKIPELFAMHQKFLTGLQQKNSVGVGIHFENLAKEVDVYGAFLQNYSRAVDTVRKCSQNNHDFADITRSIRLRSLNINSGVSLETLLYSPVSRIQKNVEIIQDLSKHLPDSHPDFQSLNSALKEFQSFLNEFKMVQPEQLSAVSDRSSRHLVKNSFIVELSEGHRKLRHLFLFNDVLVCAKYKASGKNEKYTFELKWYIPVADCLIVEESSEPREATPINLVALRSQASTVRDQIKRQSSRDDSKKAKADKQRKKLAELEAQLVLASPNLVFKVKASNGRAYTFFLSSEYERSQWVDAIEALKQASQPPAASQLSMNELQNWLTSCRKHLKTNMGSYLLRTGRDETLLVGDFYVLIGQLKGIQRPADLYICLELDSYGHFFRKAKTKMICGSTQPNWNQDFIIELEGAQNLRILLYEEHPVQGPLIRAKTTIELSRNWLHTTNSNQVTERKVNLQDFIVTLSTRFIPSEMTIRRVPTAKPSGLFGAKITQVCKREKRQIPFIMTSCVREIERRGINEVGIYRVSGSASDVSRLKKAFESNCYEAEQLLKEVDVHSTTSLFKCYLRELPEALFTDELYPRFSEAFGLGDLELRKITLMQLFSTLPPLNQHIIMFLLDHMVRINSHENHNKMSLHNLATVFGPTLLRPGTKNEGIGNIDLLAAGTADVMAQAGILYFFLSRRANSEPIQPNQ